MIDFLLFDKYVYYIWFSYLLTFGIIIILFIRTKSIHKNTMIQLRIKYTREK
ncbi:heme exporter protein CcmD [Candidatus Thioglobus sp.]|uniref:heme exporter protein CcmD n=1 Tax=Candidatus Thioglobus sp. TaxID=2026721 RepID=UPI001775650B|nr:heme exporter protein CcmD [Candidatus Thioglobus sp.]